MLRNKAHPKRRWLDLAPGDPVIVVTGKDKGKQGEVLRTIPDTHKIVVKGVNILKRHTKAGQSRGRLAPSTPFSNPVPERSCAATAASRTGRTASAGPRSPGPMLGPSTWSTSAGRRPAR